MGRTAGPTASVQKDNDWTEAGFTMDLAPAVREKEHRGQKSGHCDHDVGATPQGRAEDDPHGPHKCKDGSHVFMGLIDFLIPWNMKKRFEFLYKSLKGNRKTASCNPPWSYSARQIAWMDKYW